MSAGRRIRTTGSRLNQSARAGHQQSTPDDDVHLTCCSPVVFLCGVEPGPDDVVETVEGISEDDLCPMCRLVDDSDLPCPVEGCGHNPGGTTS